MLHALTCWEQATLETDVLFWAVTAMRPMEDRKSAGCKRRTAALLCVVTTCLFFLVTMEAAGTSASRSLNNANQSCLDVGSSDVQRDCPVGTAQANPSAVLMTRDTGQDDKWVANNLQALFHGAFLIKCINLNLGLKKSVRIILDQYEPKLHFLENF
jgi:hypothetical protein